MRTVGNILWLVLAGFWLAVSYVIAGIVCCVLIVTIPFGLQAFKLAGFALWPFGKMVVPIPDRSAAAGCVGNVIWFVVAGFWLALEHLIVGLILCVTIVGIPLGLACFKMIPMTLAPFGKRVVPATAVVPPGAFGPPPMLG